MSKKFESITKMFSEKNIKYSLADGKAGASPVISVSISGKYSAYQFVILDIDKCGTAIILTPYIKGTAELRNKLLEVVNECNFKYRFFTFSVDKDNDVFVKTDLPEISANVGDEVFELIARFINVLDAAYPSFMKVIWN